MQHRLFHIQLPLPPGWDAIEPFRAAVLACVRSVFPKPELAASVGIVVVELLENAVKFGRWAEARGGSFGLRVDGHDDRVEIEVTNPVVPGDENVERLRAELRRIETAPSPEEAYLKVVRGLALGKVVGLGLSRAVHEGGCRITAEVVGDVLHVRATTRRLAPQPPTPAAPG